MEKRGAFRAGVLLFALGLVATAYAGNNPMPLNGENILEYLKAAESVAEAEGYGDLHLFVESIMLDRFRDMTLEEMLKIKKQSTRRVLVEPMETMGYDYEATIRAAANQALGAFAEMKGTPSSENTELRLKEFFTVMPMIALPRELAEFLVKFEFLSKDTAALLKQTK